MKPKNSVFDLNSRQAVLLLTEIITILKISRGCVHLLRQNSILFSSPSSRSMLHLPTIKRINYLAPMLASVLLLVLLLSGSLEFPSLSSQVPLSPTLSLSNPNSISTAVDSIGSRTSDPFTELLPAFSKWDSQVGCGKFEEKFESWKVNSWAIQGTDVRDAHTCQKHARRRHASVLVKSSTWIPDNLEGIYSCGCGLSCAWSKSPIVVDRPDALLFEGATPPRSRRTGDPLRVYLDLEASRKPTGFEDIFIGTMQMMMFKLPMQGNHFTLVGITVYLLKK